MAAAAAGPQPTFHPFPRLPYELRRAVWELCMPHRVFYADHRSLSECDEIRAEFWRKQRRPPLLSRVCQESRELVRESGEFFSFVENPAAEDRLWFDRKRDTVLIPGNLKEHDFRRLEDMVMAAGRPKLDTFTFMGNMNMDNGDEPLMDIRDFGFRRGGRYETYGCAVAMLPINVTKAAATSSQVMGPLGEELIHLVDVNDRDGISRMMKFARNFASKSAGDAEYEYWIKEFYAWIDPAFRTLRLESSKTDAIEDWLYSTALMETAVEDKIPLLVSRNDWGRQWNRDHPSVMEALQDLPALRLSLMVMFIPE